MKRKGERKAPAHTPGPWTADQSVKTGAVVAEVDRLFGQSITVRVTTTNMDKTTEAFNAESEANARLIAAAPDLLHACEVALEDGMFCAVEECPCCSHSVYLVLRLAIEKAIGGAS